MGLRSTSTTGGGEIVQVNGGHIIRATGRKDRHSKVFTSKGPRDRRVRLSAHTAIQFYDVQDRLGYDRPSKAVDWLINKAKASIDKLAQLPPWDPSAVVVVANSNDAAVDDEHTDHNVGCTDHIPGVNHTGTSSSSYNNNNHQLHSSIATTNTSAGENATNLNFQNYPHDWISRGSTSQNQDLCLSLHTTLEDPGGSNNTTTHHHNQTLFQGSVSGSGYDGGWAQQQELGRFARLMGWAGVEAGGRGYSNFHMPPPTSTDQSGYNSNLQRGTLQSSFSPYLVQTQQHHHSNHSSSMLGIGHGSDQGFMMGFSMPAAQIHGGEHHHQLQLHGGVAMSNNSAASSSSLSPDSSQQ